MDAIISLQEYVRKSELVQCAVVGAIHRYYYDECFDKNGRFKDDAKWVSDIYKILWCKHPDWRQKIKDYMKRYMIEDATVKHLHTFNKPKDFNTENDSPQKEIYL
jgi:hypothetical protein